MNLASDEERALKIPPQTALGFHLRSSSFGGQAGQAPKILVEFGKIGEYDEE